MSETVQVRVMPALKADRGQAVIRLPKSLRDRLGVREDYRVEVARGRRKLNLTLKKADRRMVGKSVGRIDRRTRERLQVATGGQIEVRRRRRAPLLGEIDGDRYELVLVERGFGNPFQISARLMRITREMVKYRRTDKSKALALFRWVRSHVEYGEQRRDEVGYRDSLETKTSGEGVCGEQAFLYVTMARLAGLKASWVIVDRDFRGRRVDHACAVVDIESQPILVDPAYQTFDIHHQKIKVLNDQQAERAFQAMRGAR